MQLVTPKSGLMDTRAAAQYLGISASSLNSWRSQRSHDIPYVKVGHRVYYRQDSLDKFLESQTVEFAAAG